jgi:proteic killer suppression protein
MKLNAINAAVSLGDIGALPGVRLKALQRDRKGQHGVWINDQWRICFTWKDREAHGVEITDYH